MHELSTFKQAMASPEAEAWRVAMQKKYDSIMRNETWILVEPTANANIIGSGWIFKKKGTVDGTTNFRARLLARGYAQIKGKQNLLFSDQNDHT